MIDEEAATCGQRPLPKQRMGLIPGSDSAFGFLLFIISCKSDQNQVCAIRTLPEHKFKMRSSETLRKHESRRVYSDKHFDVYGV